MSSAHVQRREVSAVAGQVVTVLYEPVPRWDDDDDPRTIGGVAGHMTLAVGICARGREGIVLAADGRITRGTGDAVTVETDEHMKVHGYGKFGVAFAGFTGLTETFPLLLAEYGPFLRATNVRQAGESAAAECRAYMTRFDGTPERQRPLCSMLLAGYTADVEPRVYNLHWQSGFQPAPFHWVGEEKNGAAATAIVRLVAAKWTCRPSLDEAMLLAVLAVEAARATDEYVGPPYTLAVIDPERGYRDVSDQIRGLAQRSAAIRAQIRATLGTFSQ